MADITTPARIRYIVRRGRIQTIDLLCGRRDCGTLVGEIVRSEAGDAAWPQHVVDFLGVFVIGEDGVVALGPRWERQWRTAKRRGKAWERFLWQARSRRPVKPVPIVDHGMRGATGDTFPVYYPLLGPRKGGTARFRCPVCAWVNMLQMWPCINRGSPEAVHEMLPGPQDREKLRRRLARGVICGWCHPAVPLRDGQYSFNQDLFDEALASTTLGRD